MLMVERWAHSASMETFMAGGTLTLPRRHVTKPNPSFHVEQILSEVVVNASSSFRLISGY